MIMRLLMALLAVALFAATAANAADATGGTSDTFNQIVQMVVALIGAFLSALLAWALNRYFGIKLDQNAQTTLQTAMNNGLALGISKVAPLGITSEVEKNRVVGIAMDYVKTHVPDAQNRLAAFGTDLADKLEARLVQHPASTPLTPATATAATPLPVAPAPTTTT